MTVAANLPIAYNGSFFESFSLTKRASVLCALIVGGTGSFYSIDHANDWKDHIQSRTSLTFNRIPSDVSYAQPDFRSVRDHIENIRLELALPVSQMAFMLGVTRQAIYKWLDGTEPDGATFDRLKSLSHIADAFQISGVKNAGNLIKMKAFNGMSLSDLFIADKNNESHIHALIKEACRMENAYNRAGLALSKTKPTDEWKSYISIPSVSEHS